MATADHGRPFPRGKGQAYESSNHIPLAIRWPKGINGRGRVVTAFVSFAALAPTFIEAAGVTQIAPIMQPITGRSLFDNFRSPESGRVIASRDHVLIGKERHDIGRPKHWGYPIRGSVKGDWLYLNNFKHIYVVPKEKDTLMKRGKEVFGKREKRKSQGNSKRKIENLMYEILWKIKF